MLTKTENILPEACVYLFKVFIMFLSGIATKLNSSRRPPEGRRLEQLAKSYFFLRLENTTKTAVYLPNQLYETI